MVEMKKNLGIYSDTYKTNKGIKYFKIIRESHESF
jgi:hypothetical protein